MKNLWNKILIVCLILVLVSGCRKEQELPIETTAEISNETVPETPSEMELFTRFLNGEITTKSATSNGEKQEEFYIKDLLLKESGTKYCFLDVDSDGVDELNIKSAGYLYVIKAQQDTLSILYEGSYSFPVRDNGLCGILYAFPGGVPYLHYNYKFTTFSTDGTQEESELFSWYDLNANSKMDENDSYYWMDDDVSYEKWMKEAGPYIAEDTQLDWIDFKKEEPYSKCQEYFLKNIPELEVYAEYIKENSGGDAQLSVRFDATQVYELVENDKVLGKYYMVYVGENKDDHMVNWDWFYVREDCGEILYYEIVEGKYLSLEEWRTSQYYRTYLFDEVPEHSSLLDDFLQGKKTAYIYYDLIGGDSNMEMPSEGERASIYDLVNGDGYYLFRDINGDGLAELHLLQPYNENDPSIGWCYVLLEKNGLIRLCTSYYYPRSYVCNRNDFSGVVLAKQLRESNHFSRVYQIRTFDEDGMYDTSNIYQWIDVNDNKIMDEEDAYQNPDNTKSPMLTWQNTIVQYENTLTEEDWTKVPITGSFYAKSIKEDAVHYESKPLEEADLQFIYNGYVIGPDTTMEDVFVNLGVPEGFEDNNNGYISSTKYNNRYTNVSYPSLNEKESEVRLVFLSSFVTGPQKYYENSRITSMWLNNDSQTQRGLKIGDSIQKVYELYGKPDCVTAYSGNNQRIELQYKNERGNLIIVLDETNQLVEYIFIEYDAKRSTDEEALKAYKDVLNQYYAGLSQQNSPSEFSEFCASIDLYRSCYNHDKENLLSSIGYTFYDLNIDGKQELIIGQVQSQENSDYENVLWEVYTIKDEPELILYSNTRFLNYLTPNNQIIEIWSGGATNQGVSVYEMNPNEDKVHFMEGIEVDGNYADPYFYTISDKPYDFEKYTTLTKAEYNRRRVVYGKSAVAISAVFTPFKEYVYQGE